MQNYELIKEMIFWVIFLYVASKWGNPTNMHYIKMSAWQGVKVMSDATWNKSDKEFREKFLEAIENKQLVEKTLFVSYVVIFCLVRYLMF